jgi:deoxyribodipyrimidine photo-lyase
LKKSVVWLRRDFRLADNPALSAATYDSDSVIPVFVFDPKIVSEFGPGAKPSLAFFGALLSLQEELIAIGKKIVFLEGDAEKVIPDFIFENKCNALYFNRDYEPFGRDRDLKVVNKLKSMETKVFHFKDHVLFEPHEVLNQSGEPYKVFTPYKNACFSRIAVNPPVLHKKPKIESLISISEKLTLESSSVLKKINDLVQAGSKELTIPTPSFGEKAAMKRLKNFIDRSLSTYSDSRNALDHPEGTSHLSIDLRSGAISPRQIWIFVQGSTAPKTHRNVFLSELLWRNFFITVGFHFPHVFESNFNSKYNVRWKNRESDFLAWCEGRTGYPVVDAGMRELVQTGFMHNRARMIAAMFLTKDLLIDWRWGERFFRQHLMDAELAVNNGNWQWCASTGCDAQPYFRIFNPITQAKKFDPKGIYIRKWVPELSSLDAKAYPQPIVDHAIARKECLSAYNTGG